MVDIGIDFGSTYTTVSVYNKSSGKPEAVEMSEGDSASVPSVVAYIKGKTVIGSNAKSKKEKQTSGKFFAFKMMLPEEDQERLTARGFTETHTPESVTKDFLETLLTKVLERMGETKVGHLVVGAPEIWNEKLSTVDGRAKLRDICRSLSCVGADTTVQIISEPVAASAFFAHTFSANTGKAFNGNILLVDYGGGTLDITLTNVELRPDPSGKQNTEVKILYRTGAGENEEKGNIGRAGIIYMETLTRLAIRRAMPEEEISVNSEFLDAVDRVEAILKNNTELIGDIFEEYGTDPRKLDEKHMDEDYLLDEFLYRKEDIPLTYQMMAEAYREVIEPIFREKLEEVKRYMDQEGISYTTRTDDGFKIALVGGFGNFYLVKNQLDRSFKISSSDRRCAGIMGGQSREKAVSLGAALVSGEVIRIRNTAPFSIGVACKQGKYYTMSYGLRYGQDIEFNKEYPQRKGERIEYVMALDGIREFLINFYADEQRTLPVPPREIFLKLIRDKIHKPPVSFGFSLDSSGIITLHVHEYDVINRCYGESQSIELSNIKKLFDTQGIPEEKMRLVQESVQNWRGMRGRA